MSYSDLLPKKVCVVGSGNWYFMPIAAQWEEGNVLAVSMIYYKWGSVIAKIVGLNVIGKANDFDPIVTMYVYEEVIDGTKLTEIINLKHENVKYLPGVRLPDNVVANANVLDACHDADILVFVLPHQFMAPLCKQLRGKCKKTAIGVSLIKGLSSLDGKLNLLSNIIRNTLNIECAVLMGANVASEVAKECFCEATIGCRNSIMGLKLKAIFQAPYFRIVVVADEEAVELCGALKNIVAVGAGFVDGLAQGDNTKAAVIRLGLMEIIEFCKRFFPGCKIETFLQSCGMADLLTTCYGGRNRKVAEAFASLKGVKTIETLEKEMLNGQKLQGPPTAAEVNEVLLKRSTEEGFPIFTMVHKICNGTIPPTDFLQCLKDHPEHA